MPAYHMRIKTEQIFDQKLRKNQNPGPGAYNSFKTSLSNVSFTMLGKNNKEDILNKNMTIKMKKSLVSLRESPGPHEYNCTTSSFDSASS